MPKKAPPVRNFSFAEFFPRRIYIAAAAVRQLIHLAYASEFGLTDAQFRIVGRLKNFGPSTQQEISAATSLDKMAVSRAVLGLVKRGFVDRQAHDEDGRSHLLGFTDEGVALSVELEARAVELETALLETWTGEEIKRFRSDLERLTDQAQKQILLIGPGVQAKPGVPKVRRRR